MPGHPTDLRLLDPDNSPDGANAEDLFVARVMVGVSGQADLYPLRMDPLLAIWYLARPMLLAASVVLTATATMWAKARFDSADQPMTVAAAVGVPPLFLARSDGGAR